MMRLIFIFCDIGMCLLAFFQTATAQSDTEAIQQRIDKLQAEIDSMRYWVTNQDMAVKPTLYWTYNGILMGGLHAAGGLGGFIQGSFGTVEGVQNWDKQPGATIALSVSMFSLANAGFAAYSLIKYADKALEADERNRHRKNFWVSVGAETLLLATTYTILSIHDHRVVKDRIRKQAEIQLLQEQLKRLSIEPHPDSGELTLLYRVTF